MTEGTNAAPAHTTCAIVGGGPAGIVLGLLLARAGIEVTVLEKHADFLRDFRGDTVHPATLGLLDDLGLFDQFDALPHSKIRRAFFPGREGTDVFADFSRLPVRHPYIAMVPQWDLLDLLAGTAAAEPSFTLLREHDVTAVTRRNGRATGVAFTSPSGDGRLTADLVVGCDGRWSTVRRSVGLAVREIPVGFDVWWYRLTTDRHLDESLLPRVRDGKVAIGIPRRGYVQVAALGLKDTDVAVRTRGIEAFRRDAATLFPELADAVDTVASMDDVKHLDVRLERLRRWHANNILCIGDAAHPMSPVGGVGINLAIQDAVATARLLAGPLARGEAPPPGRQPRAGPGAQAPPPGGGRHPDPPADPPRAGDHAGPGREHAGPARMAPPPRPRHPAADGHSRLRDRGGHQTRARTAVGAPTGRRGADQPRGSVSCTRNSNGSEPENAVTRPAVTV
ncbi:FAD-dependent oxidoreductase [Microbacterium sp. ET2]|uniref:FAD-dependent oxidoreductase n=1 Tax=Microbacterium albipurpureum TaxID=3050384 RepID=UPI00259C695E|nr:FAD-dependent oxidoreductase [Microbacterium sp. ET2 (Ac-2212)]WJL94520.1 FAD-dependent oxidoreductase [Microbacterium sp. ET2 (Ac-2212)]